MFAAADHLAKLGFGGLFGAAIGHVLLLFFELQYADGSAPTPEEVMLTTGIIGAALGRFIDAILFGPISRRQRFRRRREERHIMIEDIRNLGLPEEAAQELLVKRLSRDYETD